MFSVAHWILFSNPPLTADEKRKSTTSLLDGAFSLFICTARRRRLGMSERSDEIPVRAISCPFLCKKTGATLLRSTLLARALPAGKGEKSPSATNPRRRLGMSERSDEIPDQCKIPVDLHLAISFTPTCRFRLRKRSLGQQFCTKSPL